MDHTLLKDLFKGDDRVESWLYMEEIMEQIIRDEYASGLMGAEITTYSNYAALIGSNTRSIERRGYHEALKEYVHEVDDVLNYFNMYKFHQDASVEVPEGDQLTEIGLGIWSMVIKRLDDAYEAFVKAMGA